MITIQGKGVSRGIAKGPHCFFRRPTTVPKAVISGVEAQKARLTAAQEASIAQRNLLTEDARTGTPEMLEC